MMWNKINDKWNDMSVFIICKTTGGNNKVSRTLLKCSSNILYTILHIFIKNSILTQDGQSLTSIAP